MKRLLLVLFVLFTVLLALPRTPGLASPRPAGYTAAAALQPVIATASERTLNKLSPDLRTLLAHDPEGAPSQM
jgi:hypothetical protein